MFWENPPPDAQYLGASRPPPPLLHAHAHTPAQPGEMEFVKARADGEEGEEVASQRAPTLPFWHVQAWLGIAAELGRINPFKSRPWKFGLNFALRLCMLPGG